MWSGRPFRSNMGRKSQIGNDYYNELLTVGPFGGIDDTTSPYFLAPMNFADCSNIVPNQNYGGYTTVPGRIEALASALPSVPFAIGCMQRESQPDLYFFALDHLGEGQIWTGQIGFSPVRLSLPQTLTAGARFAYFVPSRKWLFFTNGLDRPLKIDTSVHATFWGMVAPSTAPTTALSGVGPLIGSPYYYVETFSNSDQESSQGVISIPLLAIDNSITITPTATTTDPQITTRNLYRLGGALGAWYLIHSQAVGDLTPFLDVIADDLVNGQPLVIFRDPPLVFKSIAGYQDRVFGFGTDSDPTFVAWTNFNEPWGFNFDTNVLEAAPNDFGDIAVTCKSNGTFLVLTKTRSTHAVVGNSDTTFAIIELFPNVGCTSPSSLVVGDNGIMWDALRSVQFFDGSQRIDISDGKYQTSNVKTFLKSLKLADRKKSVGFYWDRMYFMSYPSVNKTVFLDERSMQWFVLDFALAAAFSDPESEIPVIGANLELTGQVDQWFASTTNGDLGVPITASIESRTVDGGSIASDVSLRFFYIEAPVQTAAVNVGLTANPGENEITEWREMRLDQSGTPRQRWEVPQNMIGQTAKFVLQTTSLKQITIWRAAVYSELAAMHQPSSATDFGGIE